MKVRIVRLMILLVVMVMAFTAVSLLSGVKTAVADGPWYVNASSGNDSNSCLSAGSACATINEALGKATAGDTVYISAGTYDEALTINEAINLVGKGAAQTILTNGGGTAVTIQDGNGNLVQFPVTLQNLAIQDASNTGLFTSEAVTLQNVAVKNNGNGGIYNVGSITMTNSTISGNIGGSGAAIINFDIARMTMTDVTVSGNTGSSTIVHVQNNAHATLTNVTISGNYTGTALVTSGSAVVTVTNSTIVSNTSYAIEDYSAGISMQNTVIANNDSPNCWSLVNSLGSNLEDDNTCGFDHGSDLIDTEPALGALANNGGDLLTHVPLAGSPLIDAGSNTNCPTTDARGEMRPLDGDGNETAVCDIGAVEYKGTYTLFIPAIFD